MLAISSSSCLKDEKQGGDMESFSDDFPDFSSSDANLLDSIDFDDLYMLPDLEMDPDILADFSIHESDLNTSSPKAEEEKISSKPEGNQVVPRSNSPPKARKSSGQSKSNNGGSNKRKVKVDWTPELHRRFVQAVEQLGVDKAVPSRILEIMGIDCLTRHNIASHLQKYRSHRKHLLAREAEAANWSQRRQMYGGKRDVNPWIAAATTIGFPPPMHHFRPLHVWGHPSMHVWPPKHSPPSWPHPRPPDSSFWHHHNNNRGGATNGGTAAGTPCFLSQSPLTAQRMGTGVAPPNPAFIDFHPSKESIDAAIGDVLAKPWLPLPLGLKPPSTDSVVVELQRQGIPKIPPTCA